MRRAAYLLLASCSFTTATGFDECSVDTDCTAAATCLSHYCIALPDGCVRGPGDFRTPDRVAFGAVLPLSDATGAPDESEHAGLNAFSQAIEEMNQRMGANGRDFALYVCDTKRDSDRAKTQSSWVAGQLRVPALLTSGSQQTLDISSATRELKTMTMSATSTSPELVTEFPSSLGLMWRTAPPDTLQGRVLANLLLSDAAYSGVAKIGIIYVHDAYGDGLQTELSGRLRAAGKQVVTAPFDTGGSVTGAVQALATAGVNATVVIGVTSDTKAILQAAFARPELLRASGHRWAFADASKDPDILTVPQAVPELAGSLGTAPAQGAGTPYPTFRDAYFVKFGVDPGSYSFTSHSYDAMYLLGLAASYAVSQGRTLDGPTMAQAMGLMSSGQKHDLAPSAFSAARNDLSAGNGIDVEGNSGHLDYIPDAGAPYSLIEEWRIEADAGFSTVTLIDPPQS